MTPKTESAPDSRRSIRIVLIVTGVVLMLVGGFFVTRPLLERSGIYLVPPSPTTYAENALTLMNQGIEATDASRISVREKVLQAATNAPDYAALYPVLADAAEALGGAHSSLLTGDDATAFLRGSDADNTSTEAPMPSVKTADGVTTVVLPELMGISDNDADAYVAAIAKPLADAQAATTAGWIVDLRGNGGGNMWPMLAAVSPLLSDGEVLSFEYIDHSESVTNESGTLSIDAQQQANSTHHFTTDLPIAVLIDGGTGSSGEAVAISFIGQEGVRLFGTPSYGFSTANQTSTLYDGAVLNMTIAVDADRTGKRYGAPIQPDVVVSGDAAAAATSWLTTAR